MAARPLIGDESPRRRWPPAWTILSIASSLVILVAVVRGLWRGYEPTADIAIIELRARDVFTADNPLLGAWSSGSVRAGQDFNHPGPLQFVMYALPVRAFGGAAGLALTSAAINIASIWVVGGAGARIGGRRTALVAASVGALLVWNMGSEVLYDAWQPNVVVLPFLATMMLVWAAAVGHLGALVPATFTASFVLQSHLSYVFLVPGLLATGTIVGVLVTRRRGDGTRWQRPAASAVATAFVLWSLPLWEQFTSPGKGNLSRLLDSNAGGDGTRLGLGLGTRVFASVVAVPSGWIPPSYDQAIPTRPLVEVDDQMVLPTSGIASPVVVALALGALLAVAAWCAWGARHRSGSHPPGGLVVAGVALVLAWLTVVILPIDVLGLTPHKLRFLWPVAGFAAIAVVDHVSGSATPRPVRTWTTRVAMASCLVVAALALRTDAPTTGPVALSDAWTPVRQLRSQVGNLAGLGTVLFDPSGLYYMEPYTWPLLAEMDRRGISYVVDNPGTARNVGAGHHADADADDVDVRAYVRVGDAAREVPPGVRRVAFVDDAVLGAVAVFVASR